MRVIDLAAEPEPTDHTTAGEIVVGIGDPGAPGAEYWLDTATFTLTEAHTADRRAITVESVDDAVSALRARVRSSEKMRATRMFHRVSFRKMTASSAR